MRETQFNVLPTGYKSWLALLEYIKTQPNLKDQKMVRFTFSKLDAPLSVFEIDLDYAKARAFDELGELPENILLYYAAANMKEPYNYDYSVRLFLERLMDLKQ